MKIVAVEEHLVTPAVSAAWLRQPADGGDIGKMLKMDEIDRQLEALGADRLQRMDEVGVDVQVLSLTTPGVQNLDAGEAVALARDVNDLIAATVATHSDRFEGFATLPTPAPEKAAGELRRAVSELGLKGAMLCGRTRERNLDHRDFWPIYEAASDLRVPLHLHPQVPQRAVREVYYEGFSEAVNVVLASGAIGWHYETGVQLLRMILAGIFDRCPNLQVILGHWGEVVLFYLDRIDGAFRRIDTKLQKSVGEYIRDHVYIAPSGILSQSYLRRSIDLVGVERVLFSMDDPFVPSPKGAARAFFAKADLSQAEKDLVASGNWERLVGS